jgi:hypothetical protein
MPDYAACIWDPNRAACNFVGMVLILIGSTTSQWPSVWFGSGLINDLSLLVERAVMTPDVAQIDPDRHLDLGVPAWDFSDEALRWLLHGNRLSDPVRRTCFIPFVGTDRRSCGG